MSNSYYNHSSGIPATQTRGSSLNIRAELDLIEDGFDAVETAMNLKAPKAGPTFTGTAAFASVTISGTLNGVVAGIGAGSIATNAAFGATALNANTTGANNTAVGNNAGLAITIGAQNTAVGSESLKTATTSSGNTAVGYKAANLTTGARNTLIGWQAGRDVSTGASNVAIGANSQILSTSGSYNTAVGDSAMSFNITGDNNVAVGYAAMANGTGVAADNTALGTSALFSVSTGTNNIGIGKSSGDDAVRTITTNSNEIVMGNNSHTAAYIKIAWTVTSDARDKTNIAPVPLGLDFVRRLNPVAYRFRASRGENQAVGAVRYGFLAQEVAALEGSPVITDVSDPENLKYNESSLVPVMVKAIQELKAEVDSLRSQLLG